MCFEVMGQQPIVLSDCKIRLAPENTLGKYPDELRMIAPCVLQDGKPGIMRFITNQFEWSLYSICELNLARWGIEGFFQEIKQALQSADFLQPAGTLSNGGYGLRYLHICGCGRPHGQADGKDRSGGSSLS